MHHGIYPGYWTTHDVPGQRNACSVLLVTGYDGYCLVVKGRRDAGAVGSCNIVTSTGLVSHQEPIR